MASWTTPTIFATGNILDVPSANTWSNNLTFLYQRPYATANNTVGVSIGGATTPITLDTFAYNGYGFSISSNNLILPLTGSYIVSGQVQCAQASGTLISYIYHNGSGVVEGSATVDTRGVSTAPVPAQVITATNGDTLGLVGECIGAGGTTITSSAATFLSVAFLGSI